MKDQILPQFWGSGAARRRVISKPNGKWLRSDPSPTTPIYTKLEPVKYPDTLAQILYGQHESLYPKASEGGKGPPDLPLQMIVYKEGFLFGHVTVIRVVP